MIKRLSTYFIKTVGVVILASCGGGGGGGGVGAGNTSTAADSSSGVTLAAATVIQDGTTIGSDNPNWGSGSTSSGAQGQLVDGFACGVVGSNYSYAHLNIYQNGKLLSLPANIGVVSPSASLQTGCVYPVHTRDQSGKIRINGSVSPTLGGFFDLWGQPLSRSNIAGIVDQPVKVYTNDNGSLTEYTGDLASLKLLPQREITIVAGSAVSQIPTYSWQDPPPLSQTPIPVWQAGTIGTVYWPDGDTASGGQGSPTAEGVVCEPDMSDNYHVHAHVSIIKDGQMLAIPQNIGITSSCYYDLHTHDQSGVVHTEAPSFQRFTLGGFFSVWGQPLSSPNVAGLTGEPVKVYISEGGEVWQYQGNPADIDMVSHRSITIQVGSQLSEIPSYSWGTNAQ